ncbi:MAG: thrombospondin type 3 repeat-containing protein [Gammaproteobacteria bacterium]
MMFTRNLIKIISLTVVLCTSCAHQSASRPDSVGDALLTRLEAERPEVFYTATDENGNATYLAAGAIGTGCAVNGDLPRDAVALADCVAQFLAAELWRVDDASRLLPRKLVRDVTDEDGYREILTVQEVRGHPVLGTELELTFDAQGNVLEVIGRAATATEVSAADDITSFSSEREALQWVEKRLGHTVVVDKRYFDPTEGALMLRVAPSDEDHIRHLINERLRQIVATDDLTYENHALVDQNVVHAAYDNRLSARSGSRQSGVQVTRRVNADDCLFSLDHGSSHDQGEPKVGIKVDGKYRPDGSTTFRLRRDCDSDSVFRFAPSAEGIADDAVNAYFWLHDLSQFSRHPNAAYDARYPWRSYDPENLRVIVAPSGLCPGLASACAKSGMTEYKILLPTITGSAFSLSSMAHEFGHIIHFMYDRTPTSLRGRAVDEGFADHNLLRYALFRFQENANRPFDEMSELNYDDGTHLEYGHHSGGIATPSTHDTFGLGHLVYDRDSRVCSPDSASSPHACGDVLASIYWELAWNECRTGYRSQSGVWCSQSQTIIEENPDAVRLANIAFTSAIRKMRDHHDMVKFFDFVSWRYSRFLIDGDIGALDYQRVLATLNHHCLGWNHDCDKARILTTHQLPIRRAERSRLRADCQGDDCEMLILATEARRSLSVDVIAHTQPGTTIPIEDQYVTLDDAADRLDFDIDIVRTGVYEFRLLSRTDGPCCDSVFMTVDGGVPLPWSMAGNTPLVWSWATSATSLGRTRVLEAGRHNITFSHRENLDIEALLVRHRADSDGDGVPDLSDNCVSQPNTFQFNKDGDLRGDACDKCPDIYSMSGHQDQDGDGVGDECDNDKNGDGVPDSLIEIEDLKNLGAWP